MKREFSYYILISVLILVSCTTESDHDHDDNSSHEINIDEPESEFLDLVHISKQQFQSLNITIDNLPKRNIESVVEANGLLEVPPQNEAAVTAIIGANVIAIKVIEGDKVKKGQVLALLSHPDLIKLQTEYTNNWNQLQYFENEYLRQKRLYDEKVGSGKEFQKTRADYLSMKGTVKGYEAQIRMMGMDLDRIRNGEIYELVPIVSPLDGHIRLVEVKTGQYVQPQTEMFEIVNIEHIHADLMVFEKDMHKVSEGQKVRFSVESIPEKELEAIIYSVGKSFESDPKAIHIHAEIENKEGLLIPGMYIRGRIITNDELSYALPEEGVVREGDKYFIFVDSEPQMDTDYTFRAVEVAIGQSDAGWIEIKLLHPLRKGEKVAWNTAYYLMAEMKKGEAEHSH